MIAYPNSNNVRWLRYGRRSDRLRHWWPRVFWSAYTAGVAAAAVGCYRLAQILF